MAITKGLRVLSGAVMLVAALGLFLNAQAANVPLSRVAWKEPVQARFDPLAGETRVVGRVTPELCFSLQLPREWRKAGGAESRLKAAISNAELELGFRSAHELRHMPQPDLASRDAAFLQQGYEDLLGRPAQAVSLASSASGATLWSATWIDGHLPTASHAMTVETFIVPLSSEWVLELSLTNIEMREVYSALARRLLADLKVRHGTSCEG